jgi:hypothetical protein
VRIREMRTTDKIINYFAMNTDKADKFTIDDIISFTGLRREQVEWVIQFWRRFAKVEKVKLIRNGKGHNKYALYRLKTAGKKYINKKMNRLVYGV